MFGDQQLVRRIQARGRARRDRLTNPTTLCRWLARQSATLVLLSFWMAADAAAYEIRLFPAQEIYDPRPELLHERLGLEGRPIHVEDFEESRPQEWLRTELTGANAEGGEQSRWTGQFASAAANRATFEMALDGVRIFGVGLADNDGGGETLSINGGAALPLNQLPKHRVDASGRAYYIVIEAEEGELPIRSVAFDQAFTIQFDHLIVVQENSPLPNGQPSRKLVLDLVDGSRLIGDFVAPSIGVTARGLKLDVPVERISSLQFRKEENTATLLLRNGEKLLGEVALDKVEVTTVLGNVSVPKEKIREVRFRVRLATAASAGAGFPSGSGFHADEPSFEGKALRVWLQECTPRAAPGTRFEPAGPIVPDSSSPEELKAQAVVRQMGATALPFLMEMLRKGSQNARLSVYGFAALGEVAAPVVSELMQLLDESDEAIRESAIRALGYAGPSASKAVPALIGECRAGSVAAVESLGNIGPAAAEAVPVIVARLKQAPPGNDLPFIVALGKIGSKGAVSVLIEIVQQEGGQEMGRRNYAMLQRRQRAIEALGKLGPQAEEAVAFLVEQLEKESTGNVSDLYVKQAIIQALGAIGPAARSAVPLLQEIARNERFRNYRLARPAAAALLKIEP